MMLSLLNSIFRIFASTFFARAVPLMVVEMIGVNQLLFHVATL